MHFVTCFGQLGHLQVIHTMYKMRHASYLKMAKLAETFCKVQSLKKIKCFVVTDSLCNYTL